MAEDITTRYPNCDSYEEVAYDATTAVDIGDNAPETAQAAHVQVSVASRIREDGTAPTAAIGLRLSADAIIQLDEAGLDRAKVISEAGAGVLRIHWYRN